MNPAGLVNSDTGMKFFVEFIWIIVLVNEIKATSSCKAVFTGWTKLKARVRYFHQIFIFSPNDSPSKTMKNAFYSI